MTAQTMVRLRDSTISATVRGNPETTGGNITIDPEFVILEQSQILSDALQGRGGDITITASVFLADPSSLVQARALDSEVGIDGQVDIRTPVTNLSNISAPLTSDFARTAVLSDPCVARLQRERGSSFAVRERASVPASPDDIFPSRLYETQPPPAAPAETEAQPDTAPARRRQGHRGERRADPTAQAQGIHRPVSADSSRTLAFDCGR